MQQYSNTAFYIRPILWVGFVLLLHCTLFVFRAVFSTRGLTVLSYCIFIGILNNNRGFNAKRASASLGLVFYAIVIVQLNYCKL